MTKEQLLGALKKYQKLFHQLGCHLERQMDATTIRKNLGHAAWMAQEAMKFVEEERLEKVNRWLGFIQGVLWSHGIRTIDQMRYDNMPAGEEFKERELVTRPDGPVGARHVSDAGHYDITLRVYVRSAMGKDLPDQRQVENKISDLLLAMPRLDEGVDWDVSSTSLPDA